MYGNRGFGGQGRGGFSPVNVGEEVDVKIEAVGEKGDGVAKVKGFVLFVPNTKEGDEVRIKVTKVLKNVGFAEVIGQADMSSEESQEESEDSEDSDEEAAVADEATEEESEEPQEIDNPEDSEDFGEELEEDKNQ